MSSTDIILNRASVALARSQRLVASWLPPQTTEEQSSNAKSEEELQREEDEIFTAVPETLGVGAPLPSKLPDGSWNRAELDSNDALRRQLLGRNYQKVMKEKERERETRQKISAASGDANNLNSGVNKEVVEEDSYDEEDGRTAAVGRKFAKGQGQGQGQALTKNQRKKNNEKRKAAEEQLQSQSQTATATATAAPGGGDGEEGKQEVESQGDEQEDTSTKQDAGTSGSSSRPAPRKKKATSFLDEILAERSKKRKKR